MTFLSLQDSLPCYPHKKENKTLYPSSFSLFALCVYTGFTFFPSCFAVNQNSKKVKSNLRKQILFIFSLRKKGITGTKLDCNLHKPFL